VKLGACGNIASYQGEKRSGRKKAAGKTASAFPRETLHLSRKAAKGCGKRPESRPELNGELQSLPEKKWTVLLYAAANDDLASDLLDNIREIEDNAGSGPEINLLADRLPPPHYRPNDYGSKVISQFYYLERQDEQTEASRVIARDDRIKVNSAAHLEKSLALAMKKFPACNYLIIMSGHGSGFPGLLRDRGDKSLLPLSALQKALKNAELQAGVDKKQVVLGFDACMMGEAEAAYEFKDVANYYLASPSETGVSGWPFHTIMREPRLPEFSQREMIDHIIEENRDRICLTETLSAFDQSRMPQVKEGMDQLAGAILRDKPEKEPLRLALRAAEAYQRGSGVSEAYIDLGDFCRRISSSRKIKDQKVKQAARNLGQVLQKTVVNEAHYAGKYPDATGISAYPAHQSDFVPEIYPNHDLYPNTAIGRDTRWGKAMDYLLS